MRHQKQSKSADTGRLGSIKQGAVKRDGFYNDKYADKGKVSMDKREWIKDSE